MSEVKQFKFFLQTGVRVRVKLYNENIGIIKYNMDTRKVEYRQ